MELSIQTKVRYQLLLIGFRYADPCLWNSIPLISDLWILTLPSSENLKIRLFFTASASQAASVASLHFRINFVDFSCCIVLYCILSYICNSLYSGHAAFTGENGEAVTINKDELSAVERAKFDAGWQNNAFNQYASDMISLHRSLPDIRDEEYVLCMIYRTR